MEYDEVIKKRASIRKYNPEKKVSLEEVMDFIEAAHTAPSPGNLAILRYLVVQDKEKISKIAEAAQQSFIQDAPILVVVCSDKSKAKMMYDELGNKYATQAVGAAIENFLLKVVDAGMVSCWIGSFSDLTVRNLLSIPDDIEIEAILPVAYRSKTDISVQRTKPSMDKKIWFEKWNNKYSIPPRKVRREDI